ncbi:tRNA pseudouridine(55) synthase TruB [Limnohabitans sp. TS-CS-82]|uniref:tRNA pseudouridine(55) synthase TruB n=1 Tax=Limnohabitans sp. TS-CS-82 TaxID=2094193 RepID=UPI000CF2250D|nr:tRNA pseudouridine(55) synthase TruB [Limnohabitans sp. TS-CS-82]PQA81444.1 tRNA pseudouridine(55) synthase TruB [Limnohabitans sp. TS-CS-82]
MNAPRTRVQRRPVHGVLLLDKPYGLSSNDALQKAKWLLRAEKAGHTGTLDPLATGVLPLCFGAATKFSQLHLDADKSYEAIAVLGIQTSTGDLEGEVVLEKSVDFTPEQLRAVQAQFTGPISQVPPMYSALKKDGKALYDYARAGIEVEREARQVTIQALHIEEIEPENGRRRLKIEVTCSKGTYIRTLGEDIAIALGTCAHLSALRRTVTGPFVASQCITVAELEALTEQARETRLLPVDALLDGHTPVTLAPEDAGRFLSGVRRRGSWPDSAHIAVYGQTPHALLGTAHVTAGELIPGRLLSPIEIQSILECQA